MSGLSNITLIDIYRYYKWENLFNLFFIVCLSILCYFKNFDDVHGNKVISSMLNYDPICFICAIVVNCTACIYYIICLSHTLVQLAYYCNSCTVKISETFSDAEETEI